MKIKIAKWVVIVTTFFYCNESFSQDNEFKDRNVKYLDSVELVIIKYICQDSISYPKFYKKKLIDRDLAIIRILNTIYSKNAKAATIDSMLSKLKNIIFGKEEKL